MPDLDKSDTSLTESSDLGCCIDAVVWKLDKLEHERQARLKATKGRFNIFTVLLKQDDEVRLHTRFLAHLLNPNCLLGGTDALGPQHDCGDVFLRAFLNELVMGPMPDTDKGLLRSNLVGIDTTRVKVHKEFHTDGKGNIDILMDCPGWGGIAIENKIYAKEQPNQIRDYASFLQTRYPDNRVLLYLTLDGKEACTHEGCTYYCISYQDTILRWLEECLKATYAYVNINQTLQQYRDIVLNLTGRKKEQDMSAIADVIRTHPRIIKHLSVIGPAVEHIRDDVREDFLAAISQALHQQEEQYTPLVSVPANDAWIIQRCGNPVNARGCNVVLKYGDPDQPIHHFWVTVQPVNGPASGQGWPDDAALCNLIAALKGAFPQGLQGVEDNQRVSSSTYFRAGWCYLPLPDLSDAGLADLLAKQASDNHTIREIADTIAKDIIAFVRVVQTTWPST